MDFTWARGCAQVRLSLREPRLIEAASLLLALPAWQRGLARLFANPYYFRFDASLHLEIDLEETRDSAAGPALYEMMLLR